MSNTTTITVFDLERLQTKVESLNKKAAKAGVSPVTWTLLETVTTTKKTYDAWTGDLVKSYEVFDHYEVEIVAEEVVLPGGWRLVGVIDHTESLVRSVPGETLELRSFVERGPVCDHCHTSRDRNETFVLVNETGEVKQVGRQCVGLFLGISPERALNMVGMVSESMVFDEEWTGTPRAKGYNLKDFLCHTACMVRMSGWRSRTNATPANRATADLTLDNMVNQFLRLKDKRTGEPLWVNPSPADCSLAVTVAEWMAGLVERADLSDYMSNLAQIGENQFCTDKSAGYAASGINAFLKETEEKVKQEAKTKSGEGSKHVGAVGARITVVVNKVSSAGYDSQYGYQFFHKMVDEFGNILVWKTGTEMENGRYKMTGTVKSHDEFRGEKQTNITRCKLGLAD